MAWSSDDVARSIRRYLQLILPAGPTEWTHRLERRVIPDEERPVGVILLGGSRPLFAREGLDQGEILDQIPVTITCYPEVGADARAARREGDQLRDLLRDWVMIGMPVSDGLTDENGRVKAGPFRLPLWDWDGVSDTAGEDELPERPHDVITVEQGSLVMENLADPEDERRRSVVIEFRAKIERPGRTTQIGNPVSGISGEFAAE